MISFGSSKSTSQPGYVWGGQAPYLQSLYGNAQALGAQQMGGQYRTAYSGGGYGGQSQNPSGPGGAQTANQSPGTASQSFTDPYTNKGGSWQERIRGRQVYPPMGLQRPEQIGPSIQDYAGDLAGGLMQGAGGWMSPGSNPAIQNLMARSQMTNPFLENQIQSYGQDLGSFFQNQILPGITSQAGLSGQFGGSRHGIGAGLAGQGIMDQFARGASQMRYDNYNSGQQAANFAGNLANSGIGQMGDLYNLGMSPWSAAWAPLQNMGALMGTPTVLGGGSSGRSTSFGLFNFGGSNSAGSSGGGGGD